MERYFGCHVSVAGGLENALVNAETLGVNTIQIHPSQPQRWNYKPFEEGAEEKFLSRLPASGVEKVFFHAIYLINLATPDQEKLKRSKKSIEYYLDFVSRIGGEGVIVHVGSNKDQPDAAEGLKQAAAAIDEVMKNSDNDGRLLLEVAAGSGKIIGSRFEDLAIIYEQLSDPSRVGFALDTQHMWASGYDLEGSLEEIVEEADKVLGLEHIKAIHVNDSKTALGSLRDRHANIGEGLIGSSTLKAVVTHPKLAQIPLILETPGLKDKETAAVEVAALRELLDIRAKT